MFVHTGAYAKARGRSDIFPLADEMIIDWRKFFDVDKSIAAETAKPLSAFVSVFNMNRDVLKFLAEKSGHVGKRDKHFFAEVMKFQQLLSEKEKEIIATRLFLTTMTRGLGVPIRFVGVGEGADDLRPFEAGAFADRLLSG
jgi:hypothetical protein